MLELKLLGQPSVKLDGLPLRLTRRQIEILAPAFPGLRSVFSPVAEIAAFRARLLHQQRTDAAAPAGPG